MFQLLTHVSPRFLERSSTRREIKSSSSEQIGRAVSEAGQPKDNHLPHAHGTHQTPAAAAAAAAAADATPR